MLIRLAGYAALGLLGLYALENVGLVGKREYFPSLPRLESPMTMQNIKEGASWGKDWAECLMDGGALGTCTETSPGNRGFFDRIMTGAQNSYQPTTDSFTTRISARNQHREPVGPY